jgi:cupin 2 domain-containing protein
LVNNILDFSLPPQGEESFKTLLSTPNVEIKTIVSNTLTTPKTFVQDCDEWVMVVDGVAELEMKGVVYNLKKGDTLFISAEVEHTLLKTQDSVVWLAVYIGRD